jgi:hypothetical protein
MAKHSTRKLNVRRRVASSTENFMPRCAIPGCGRPTTRAAKQGLDGYHCRYHLQYKARHGSYFYASIRAGELKPYLAAASTWIQAHRDDYWVTTVLTGLKALLDGAGPVERVTDKRGLSPHHRAKVALARLREAGIKSDRLLAINLAISALIEEDPGSHRVREFRIVQVAKAAHRLASGYHKVWEDVPIGDGRTGTWAIHEYPRSSGRVLRCLGQMIEDECDHVTDRYVNDVLALKVTRYGRHPAILKPTPKPMAMPPEHRLPAPRGRPR